MTVLQFPPDKTRKKLPPLRNFEITEGLAGERVLYFLDAFDPVDGATMTLGVFATRAEADEGLAACLAEQAVPA